MLCSCIRLRTCSIAHSHISSGARSSDSFHPLISPVAHGVDLLHVLQVNFEPREVVVHQGDVSDCMYVLKSGQVRAQQYVGFRLGVCVDK